MKKNSIIYVLGLALATASLAGCNKAPSLEGIRVKTQPTVTEYAYEYEGPVSLAGLEVEAVYSNETTQVITDYEHSNLTPTAAQKLSGKFTVTLTYQEKTADVKFTFREPDPYDHAWPAAKVAELVKAYAGEDVVPAWNGAEGSKFIVEEEYNDVLVVLPGNPTAEEKEAACDAYNEALLSEANGYQESSSPTFDYAGVSAHNTLDVIAYVYGDGVTSGDGEIYIAIKPHQAKDVLAYLYTRTDAVPETFKAAIGTNDNIDVADDADYKLVLAFETATEAAAKLDELVASLYAENYIPYGRDKYGDMHQVSPNEEVDVCVWRNNAYVIVDFLNIGAADQKLTKSATYPTAALEIFLNEGHTAVPAVEASEFYFSNDGVNLTLFARFENNEAATAYVDTYKAALAENYTASGSTYTSTNNTVQLQLSATGKFVVYTFANPARFPLQQISNYFEEDYAKESFPCIPESTGNVYFSFSSSSYSVLAQVTARYASADAAAAAYEAYVATFTAEGSGYEAYVGGGYYKESLGLRFVPSIRANAAYFTVAIYEWNKTVDVDELISGTFELEEGEEFGFPGLIVRSNVNVVYDDKTYISLDAVAFTFDNAFLSDKYGFNYALTLNQLYDDTFGLVSYDKENYQYFIFQYLPKPYISIGIFIVDNSVIFMFSVDEEAAIGWAALNTYLDVENYEEFIPEINGNHFDFITLMNDGSVVLQYLFEGDEDEVFEHIGTWSMIAMSYFGFSANDDGTLQSGKFLINFGITEAYDGEEVIGYVITFYIEHVPPITEFPAAYINDNYGTKCFLDVEFDGDLVFEPVVDSYGDMTITVTGSAEDIAAFCAALNATYSAEGSGWVISSYAAYVTGNYFEYYDVDGTEYDLYWNYTEGDTSVTFNIVLY